MGIATKNKTGQRTGSTTIKDNVRNATDHGWGGEACPHCDNRGYPVLPLRYAVVGEQIGAGDLLSPDALGLKLGGGVIDKPDALQAHRYVVRTLREGFVMVYSGGSRWDAYAVNADGHLRRLQPLDDRDYSKSERMTESCVRQGHHIKASFLYIEKVTRGSVKAYPEKVWIAFSPTLWSATVRRQHEGSDGAERRRDRMQAFDIPQLGTEADAGEDAFQLGPDVEVATRRLQQLVLEYAANAAQELGRTSWIGRNSVKVKTAPRRDDEKPAVPDLEDVRVSFSSAHGLAMRTGQAEAVARRAAGLRTPSDDRELLASAIVLRDPLGVLQEINHTRTGILSNWAQFLDHPEIRNKLLISNAIVELKHTTSQAALDRQEEIERGQPDLQWEFVPGQAHGIPGASHVEPGVTRTTTRKERAEKEVTKLWSALQKHYREDERHSFEEHCLLVLRLYGESVERAAADYGLWYEDPGWQLTKDDFELTSAEDQARLVIEWGRVFEGGATESRVHEAWAKATPGRMPPIYVALFGNQEGLWAYLKPDLPNPLDGDEDKARKAAKIYKELRGLLTFPVTTDAFEVWKRDGFSLSANIKPVVDNKAKKFVLVPAKAWLLRRHDAITGTIAAHSDFLFGRFAQSLAESVRELGVRAMQAAVKLYENREVHLLLLRLPVEKFLQGLHRASFDASRALMTTTVRGARHVASSLATGHIYLGGRRARETLIDVALWLEDGADALQHFERSRRAPPSAAQAAAQSQEALHAAKLRVHPFSLNPGTAAFVDEVNLKLQGLDALLDRYGAMWKEFARSGTAFMAMASFFFQAWSLRDYVVKADQAFRRDAELHLLVIGSALASMGSVLEVVGTFMKLMLKHSKAVVVQRLGFMVMNLSGVLEGLQCFLAAHRTGRRGDVDARNLWFASGVLFIGAAFSGAWGSAGGSALWGPWGVGAALLILAVGIGFAALQAEDSNVAIWLDRCHWGKASRFAKSGHPAERPWSDSEIGDEVAELHGLTSGLSADVGFDEDWSLKLRRIAMTDPDMPPEMVEVLRAEAQWTHRVKMRVTLPNFDDQASAFAWRLQLMDARGGAVVLGEGRHNELPGAFLSSPRRPASKHANLSFRRVTGPTTRLFVVRPWGSPVETPWSSAFPKPPAHSPAPAQPWVGFPSARDTAALTRPSLVPMLEFGQFPVRGPTGDWPVSLQLELSAEVSHWFDDLEFTIDYVANRFDPEATVGRIRLWASA